MGGISNEDGTALDGWLHCAQSIGDILTTRIGTRVLRRPYGSDVPDLVDHPMNEETVTDVTIAVAEALGRWEPRFELRQVIIEDASDDGCMTICVIGNYLPDNTLTDVVVEVGA